MITEDKKLSLYKRVIERVQNTMLFPVIIAAICVFSGLNGIEVYIPCMWAITVICLIVGMLCNDLKVYIVPAFLGYYAMGMNVSEEFFKGYSHPPSFDGSGWVHFALCIGILVVSLVIKLGISGYLKEVFAKRGIFFKGILYIDLALLLGGIFSANRSLTNLVWSIGLAATLTLSYLLFLVVLAHARDGAAYACKVLIVLGYLVSAQVLTTAYRLMVHDNFLVKTSATPTINRTMLQLGWGPVTIIGGVLVLAISAAIYLMYRRKYPVLSFSSAFIFWLLTFLIDTRVAILVGSLVLLGGTIICCVSGKNRVASRIIVLSFVGVAIVTACSLAFVYWGELPSIIDEALEIFRLDLSFDSRGEINHFLSNRLDVWAKALGAFAGNPLFGKGISANFMPRESFNVFEKMAHNIILQFMGSMGLFGVFAFVVHIRHLGECIIRRFSAERLVLMIVPASILGMSLVDNFFFYPNFMLVYTIGIAAAEIELERRRAEKIADIKTLGKDRLPRVLFPYVEAGKGHIIPTENVCKEFTRKYGDRTEIIRSQFFTETGEKDLEKTEILFRETVQKQATKPIWSFLCKLGNLLAGDTLMLYALLKYSKGGKKSNPLAVKHLEELDADIIYATHWSIPFYAKQLKGKHPYVICFCPDVYSNGAFNVDCNNFLISSDVGYDDIMRTRMYAGGNITQVPFPMRPEIENYKGEAKRAEMRKKYGIGDDEFVVVLCDGGYGMAKLEKTVLRLRTAAEPMTVIALCGMNHALYERLCAQEKDFSQNVRLIAVDFTDKVLEYIACADLFVGKSGANSTAEPAALGVPIIVTKCATYIERGIKNYYVRKIKGAMYIPSARVAAKRIRKFAYDRSLLTPYKNNLRNSVRQKFDAEATADLIWERLQELQDEKV